MHRTHILIAIYLLAIVIANLTVAAFGASAIIPNSLVLVALDLTARDRLHEAWHGAHFRRNMAALITCGSVLSAALDIGALPVAVASGVADTVVYGRLSRHTWLVRANGSNVVSAAVDSVVFLSLLAVLGGLPWGSVPLLAAGQWGAKAIGGALWALVLARGRAEGVVAR